MCLAPHIASLTVPVKDFPAAKAEETVSPAIISRVISKSPAFRIRTFIKESPFWCEAAQGRDQRVARLRCKDGTTLKKLQHCGKKKKAEVHGRAPPRGCPVGIRGEGPGKTKMSVTHSKKEVALAK